MGDLWIARRLMRIAWRFRDILDDAERADYHQ